MKNTLGVALGLAALLGGCSQERKPETSLARAPASINAPHLAQTKNEDQQETASAPGQAAPPAAAVPVAAPRLRIYHAALRLKVASLPRASARLDSLVRRSGGYASAATETRADGQWRQETTIRVRPGGFGSLLGALARLGTVEEKKLTTDDVTAEHADVAARLRAKRAVEQRYLALLGQAKKVSDMLEIEEKMGGVREEIESTESRLKALDDEVGYSTITLTCYQLLPIATPDAPVVSLGSRLVGALYGGWELTTGLLIGAVSIWPLLVLGLIGWWAARRWRRTAA